MKPRQRGNALFLILIAVALFAMLGYAITTSSRGGGNSIDAEEALFDAARVTDLAASIQKAVQTLALFGTPVEDIEFCASGSGTCVASNPNPITKFCSTGTECVFAPEGGSAIRELWPADALDKSGWTGGRSWTYRLNTAVAGIGSAANDVVLLSGNLTQDVCEAINKGLGMPVDHLLHGDPLTFAVLRSLPGTDANINAMWCPNCSGVAFGCMHTATSMRSYYHVLLPR